jgi:hypothetical protein
MSDPDRRFDRTGGEPPLTIDSHRRTRGRARGPAPVTLIVSLLLLLVVGGAVAFMYRAGPRSAGAPPEPLGKPLEDVRAPAPPQPRAADPGAGLTISKEDPNSPPAPPVLAPPPEAPMPDSMAAAPKPKITAAAPTTTVAIRKSADHADTIGELLDEPASTRATKPPAQSATLPPTGPAIVQIGAFTSQKLADQEWSKAAAVAPGAMAGMGKRVVPVTRDGDTLYRTSITGFVSRDQAEALCERLKAAGGNCFVR